MGWAINKLRRAVPQTIGEFRAGMRDLGVFWTELIVESIEQGVGFVTLAEAILVAYYFDTTIAAMLATSEPRGPMYLSSKVTLPVPGVCNLVGTDNAARKRRQQGSSCAEHQN